MFKLFILLLLLVVAATAVSSSSQENINLTLILNNWNSFKRAHRFLKIVNEDVDFLNFQTNYLKVQTHNQAYSEQKVLYKTKVNKLSAFSNEEYLNNYLSTNMSASTDSIVNMILPPQMPLPSLSLDLTSPPDNFDWRTYGLVTSVKEQSVCGSCWAFTATGAIETIYANKFGSLRRFSEQELVDCDTNNWACDGGYPTNSFYRAYLTGLVEEAYYPYKAKKGECNKNLNSTRFKIKGYAKVPSGDEIALKRIVSSYGPVAVALDASDWGFGHYSTGIFTADKCKTNVQNHAVLIVGYGTENNQDYWIVKNSWGRNWGLNGYIKMARNRNNTCGIATMASYAYL